MRHYRQSYRKMAYSEEGPSLAWLDKDTHFTNEWKDRLKMVTALPIDIYEVTDDTVLFIIPKVLYPDDISSYVRILDGTMPNVVRDEIMQFDDVHYDFVVDASHGDRRTRSAMKMILL